MKKTINLVVNAKTLGRLNTICAVRGMPQADVVSVLLEQKVHHMKPEIQAFETRVQRFYDAQSEHGGRILRKRKARKVKAK